MALVAVALVFLVAFLAAAWLAPRLIDRGVKTTSRPDQHIPTRERVLLGDDWRDKTGYIPDGAGCVARATIADRDLSDEHLEDHAEAVRGGWE